MSLNDSYLQLLCIKKKLTNQAIWWLFKAKQEQWPQVQTNLQGKDKNKQYILYGVDAANWHAAKHYPPL